MGKEGVSKGRGYMYTYGWFMLRFDRKQQNYEKQLSFNKKKDPIEIKESQKKKKHKQYIYIKKYFPTRAVHTVDFIVIGRFYYLHYMWSFLSCYNYNVVSWFSHSSFHDHSIINRDLKSFTFNNYYIVDSDSCFI